MIRKYVLTLNFAVFLSVFSAAALCPRGDLNGDCKVSFEDIIIFADQWLDAGECDGQSACANFDGLNGINFDDFSILANHWLEGLPLVINEFMASNSSKSGIKDAQNEYDDWIEIYNFGSEAINLAGKYLTDDLAIPTKWQIPVGFASQTTIAAGGFLVFWADEETVDGPLHVGFKLSAGGEDIGLYDTDGSTPIDTLDFGSQVTNISYGRDPNSSDNWRFFSVPTPGAINNGAYTDKIEDVQFSHERGFCDTSFNLTIACETSGARIYYTTDGKDPIVGEAAASGATLYTAPVTISSTTCVRAAAIKTGWMPSPTATHTYIFGASNVIKSMPVVSLVGNAENALYEPNGIMAIVGGTFVDGVWSSGGEGTYNNPVQRGIAYERPVSIEIIDLPAGNDYQQNCGIRVHGSDVSRARYTRGDDWICNSNKFSLTLFFRDNYGNNRFDYPFFPFIEVERYQSIVLRAGSNDNCSPFVKDEWTRRLFCEMGAAQLTGTFVNLYINGVYKGYYNPCGHANKQFFQGWYNTSNDFDVITQTGVRDGDSVAWDDLVNYAASHDLSITDNYNAVAAKLDIANFIDLLILQIHLGNIDWPGNNWTVQRERSDAGVFRFSVWDADAAAMQDMYGESCENCFRTAFEDFPNWATPRGLNNLTWDPISRIYRALKANVNFRQFFADRIHKHYHNGGLLMKSHLIDKWWEVYGEVSNILPYQNTYVPNVFLSKREPYVLAAFETNGLFNRSFEAPVFNVNGFDQYGGYISSDDMLTMTNPGGTGDIYYTLDGSDPRLPAIDGIAPAISPAAILYTGVFTLDQSTNLRARIYRSSDQTWSPLNEAVYEVGDLAGKLRITELMYHPSDPNTEYVELKNISASAINLKLVKFTQGINFTFGNTTLAAGQYILVVENLAAFQAKYGTGLNVAGQYTGSLDNSGERIRLDDALGNAILDFEYKDGWRSIVDGGGYSLTIINPANADTLSWGYKDSWRASAYVGGSPGTDDSGLIPNPGDIVINEVLAHSHSAASDWVELYNTTSNPINIGGWYLSDSEPNLVKYRFAAGTVIAGHGYLVVTEMGNFGQSATDSGRRFPFAFSENGDQVCLTSNLDANNHLTGYRAKEDFGASETGVSFGRYYKASTGTYNFALMASNTLGSDSLGAANSYPKVGPIVISEIMYNPDWPAGGSYVNNDYEYVELSNPTGLPVTLFDSAVGLPWKFTSGIDYTFPTTPVTIPAGGKILVVKNPTAFSWRYPGVPSSIIYGPYSGKLANDGEQLELSKPGDVDELGVRHYIRVEQINYSDGSHPGSNPVEPDLWPTAADGNDKSLGRINSASYGNDPNNWQAITPTPGI